MIIQMARHSPLPAPSRYSRLNYMVTPQLYTYDSQT